MTQLGISHFRRGYRPQKFVDFEKPDLLETCVALGIDLTERSNEGGRPYYSGPCPLHTAQRNFTTFVVFPEIQQCACLSCHASYMDSIGIWMAVQGVTFSEAVKQICSPLTQDVALTKMLQLEKPLTGDARFLAERVHSIFDRVDYEPGLRILLQVNEAVNGGKYGLADTILRGVEC